MVTDDLSAPLSVDPNMAAPVSVTYFIEVLSSWCHWTEPAWSELRQRYTGRVDFSWRVALMRPEDFPVSTEQCDWFYRRSGTHVNSPYMLNSGWFEADRAGHYEAPNWVAEAGRDFVGDEDERVRIALANAAMREGKRIGDLETSVEIAAATIGVDAGQLQTAAQSETVQNRVAASTQCFFDHQLSQRPAFIIENTIGDKATFSGLWTAGPLVATIDAMLADATRYETFAAHGGEPPTA